MEGCSICAKREKRRRSTDLPIADMEEGCSVCGKPEKKRKSADLPSADMEDRSSTSAETFKHYEPSPARHHKEYHVFLSFRRKDVRTTLVDHLLNCLSTAGFRVFPNTERLEKGKNIEFSQEDAIRNSTVHIPIFSANYASSPRCLDELSLIWTCRSTGTTVIPLFYNVKPSDVRYAKAFQEQREKHSEEKMDGWKEALHQVSLLSGWTLAESAAGYEGRLVKLIVMDLLKTLRIDSLYVARHPVGLSERLEEVKTKLELNDNSRHVLCVGIWGMGGLGKTTLAKAIYNNIHQKFEASCFVSDVRASTKDSVKGLLELQKQILQDLAKVEESTLKKLSSVSHAKSQMEDLLKSKKALVILDDVDDEEQLDALVGDAFNGYFLRAGSRIIITTRDFQVLKRQTPLIEYSMKELDPKEGLKLFSWHAFMRSGPPEGYEDITEKIVHACQCLPLALELVGGRLYNEKNLEIWREALANLVKNHSKVYCTLKISYDALCGDEKRMFLDIACFFLDPLYLYSDISKHKENYVSTYPSRLPRYDMEFYVKLCEDLGLRTPRTCLRNLEMKSLIRINYNSHFCDSEQMFWMHDLLRDLGRQITEDASPSNPAECSRFWCHKDLVRAMAQTQGMPIVEGLVAFSNAEEGLHQINCSTYPWALMANLKFMFINDLCFEGTTYLPQNLTFLVLRSCRFQEHELASETQLISFCVPKTIGELRSLRFLDMTGTSIYHLPNEVGELFNLEELYLSLCNLTELSQSFANLIKLKVLDISYNHISSFPANFHLPSSLIELNLERCYNLQKMPSMSHMKKMEALDLSGCSSLRELPSLDCTSLIYLNLTDCAELQALPALPDTLRRLHLYGCSKLQEASSISRMKKLEVLDLSLCTSLTELPSLGSMHSLTKINLKLCEKLQALPALLEKLDLSWCTSLAELPSLDSMHSLTYLNLENCALPDTSYLSLNGCRKLQEASSISYTKKLEVLDLSLCTSLTELPSLNSMHSLIYLNLEGCEELQALPALPDTLRILNLRGCRKLQEASSISYMKKLKDLVLVMCTSLTELPSLDSMHSLIYLNLEGCEELQALPALPDTLRSLNLRGCRKLQEASSISLMKKLEKLDLSMCTSLTELPSLDSMHSLRDLNLK